MYNVNNMLIKKIVVFFDKLEDKVRRRLSHYPIMYGFLGGIGVVLFWRGVWHISDELSLSSIASIVLGSIILLITGVFVSTFIGNKVIISGLVGEKRLTEKEEEVIETEETQLRNLQGTLNRVEKKLEHIDEDIEKK